MCGGNLINNVLPHTKSVVGSNLINKCKCGFLTEIRVFNLTYLIYSGFETCFAPAAKVLEAKHISNPDDGAICTSKTHNWAI